jgi:hypothetical protein
MRGTPRLAESFARRIFSAEASNREMTRLILASVLCCMAANAAAQDPRFDAGGRLVILLGDGVPANDMVGFGVLGRWHWRDHWYLGVALDQTEFDYERPNDVLGIPSAEEIDGKFDFARLSGWIERRFDDEDRGWSAAWRAGLGYASVSTEDVRGPTAGGGSWDIATNASDEVHAMLALGAKRYFGESFFLEGALHLEHHLTDYDLVDRVSGRTGQIGSQTPWGVSIGVSYRF